MNWLSFALGMIATVVLLVAFTGACGMYLKRHPEVIVRRMARSMMAPAKAQTHVDQNH